MTGVALIRCLLCEGQNKTLGQKIATEKYTGVYFDSAEIHLHQLSCGHIASIMCEGVMINPYTSLPYKKGDVLVFYKNVTGLHHNTFVTMVDIDPKIFQPVQNPDYASIQLADGLTPETATGKFFVTGMQEPYSSTSQD